MSAVPALPVFSAGVPASSQLNQLGVVAQFAMNQPGAIATRTTNQSIPNATATTASFTAETFDNMAGFAPTSDTITATYSGLYVITGGANWDTTAGGARIVTVRLAGADIPGGYSEISAVPAASVTAQSVCTAAVLLAGDTITLITYQNSGGAINITSARLSVVRLSGT